MSDEEKKDESNVARQEKYARYMEMLKDPRIFSFDYGNPTMRGPARSFTFNELHAIVKGIDVSAFPLPLRLELIKCDNACDGHLKVQMHVKERDNYNPNPEWLGTETPVDDLTRGAYDTSVVVDRIRNKLHELVLHEFYECFKFNGQRIYDPHSPSQKHPACPL